MPIKIFKTEEEWLKYKDTTIGGTAITSILNVNKYQSRLQLYRRMKGIDPPTEINESMLVGIHLEQGLIDTFIALNGGEEKYPKSKGIPMFVHPDYDFIASSPDSLIVNTDDYGDVLAEVKTTQFYISTYDDIPPQYLAQLNYNIGLAKLNGINVDTGMFIILSSGHFYQFEYEYNDDVFQSQIRAAITFKEMLDNNIQPEPSTSDDFHFTQEIKDSAVYATDMVLNYVQKMKEVKQQIDTLEKEKKFLSLQIKKYMNKNQYLLLENAESPVKLASFVHSKTNKFNTKKFKEEQPDLYNEYEEEKYMRRLIINYRSV